MPHTWVTPGSSPLLHPQRSRKESLSFKGWCFCLSSNQLAQVVHLLRYPAADTEGLLQIRRALLYEHHRHRRQSESFISLLYVFLLLVVVWSLCVVHTWCFCPSDHKKSSAELPAGAVQRQAARSRPDPAGRPECKRGERATRTHTTTATQSQPGLFEVKQATILIGCCNMVTWWPTSMTSFNYLLQYLAN